MQLARSAVWAAGGSAQWALQRQAARRQPCLLAAGPQLQLQVAVVQQGATSSGPWWCRRAGRCPHKCASGPSGCSAAMPTKQTLLSMMYEYAACRGSLQVGATTHQAGFRTPGLGRRTPQPLLVHATAPLFLLCRWDHCPHGRLQERVQAHLCWGHALAGVRVQGTMDEVPVPRVWADGPEVWSTLVGLHCCLWVESCLQHQGQVLRFWSSH